MKRICLLCLLLLALPALALGQTIAMESAHLAFDYPDSWLVLSPQLAKVYAPLLDEHGINGYALCDELAEQGVLSRAYNPRFDQHMSVIVRRDELSEEIFDIGSVTDEQRKTLKNRALNDRLWETTGLRARDVEWQREGGDYWLYIHYTKTFSDEIVGRGLRYVTVRNGMYVMLDWQIDGGRFGNRDLSYFRKMTANLTVTEMLDMPMRSVKLAAQIPQETTVSGLTIEGETTPNATLVAEAPDGAGEMALLSVGVAGASGKFSLLVPLEAEGSYDIRLTASMEGMLESSVSGTVVYSAKTLPVTLEGFEEGGVHTVEKDRTKFSGRTLAGVQIQLVTPYGVSKKRADGDGSFSFELSTEDEGEYRYTLILDKDGFDQRRVMFTLVRVMTDDQEKQAVRAAAEKISYKNLQKNLDENLGKVMSLYGPVYEISAAGTMQYIRMHFNKDASGTWYNPVIIVSEGDTGAKVGDMLTVVCEVSGVFEEQDERGEPVMVPRFDLLFVDKVE